MARTTETNAESPRNTRGRPALTPDQIADMRGRIAAVALRLFHDEGYAAVSMRRLAREVGCTPVTLYRYFDNKFEILRMLWIEVLGQLFDRLDHLAEAEPDPVTSLDAVARGYVEFWVEHREQYYLVFMTGGITQDDVSLVMGDDAILIRFDLFRRCIRDALGSTSDTADIEVRAEVLVCALNGIAQALVTMSGYPWTDLDVLVRSVTAAALSSPPESQAPGERSDVGQD